MEKFHLGQYRLVVEAIYWFGYVRDYEYLPVATEVVQETVTRTEYHNEWVELPYKNPLTGVTHGVRHYVAPNADKVKWVYGTIREIAAFEKSQVGTEDFRKGTGMDYVSDSCQYGTK